MRKCVLKYVTFEKKKTSKIQEQGRILFKISVFTYYLNLTIYKYGQVNINWIEG